MSSASPLAAHTAAPRRWLSIVGIGEDGVEGLAPVARGLIADAEVVFGGKRHLALAGALIRGTYHLLGLRTYFTAGEKEARAWTIHAGDTAPKAAGVIHSDFERGFIKAETVAYDDLVKCGSVAAAREKGLYRMEGREYIVQDGDVLLFKFNV